MTYLLVHKYSCLLQLNLEKLNEYYQYLSTEEAERRRIEEKVRLKKLREEEEILRQKEEEKKNRFRIPKKVQNIDSDKNSSDNQKIKTEKASLKKTDEKSSSSHLKLHSSENYKKLDKSIDKLSKDHKILSSENHSSSGSKTNSSSSSKTNGLSSSKTKSESSKIKNENSSSSKTKSESSSSSKSKLESSSKSRSDSEKKSKTSSSCGSSKDEKSRRRDPDVKSDVSLNMSLNISDEHVSYTHLKSDSGGNARVVNCTSREEEIKRKLQEKLSRIKGCIKTELIENMSGSGRKKKEKSAEFINDDSESEDDKHQKSKSKNKEKHKNGEHDKKANRNKASMNDITQIKHKKSDQNDRSDKLLHKHSKHKSNKESDRLSLTNNRDKLFDKKSNIEVKTENSEKVKPKIPKKPAPPPMIFSDLLKLAQAKSAEPIAFEPKIAKSKKEDMPERLMTQEEKEREEERKKRLQSKDYKDWYKYGSQKSDNDKVRDKKTDVSKSHINNSLTSKQENKLNGSKLSVGNLDSDARKQLHSKFSKSDSKLISSSSSSSTKSNPKTFHIPDSAKKNTLSKVNNNSSMDMTHVSSDSLKKMKISEKAKQNCFSKTPNESVINKKRPHIPDKHKSGGRDSPDESEIKKRKLENDKHFKNKVNKKPEIDESIYSSTNENVLECGPPKVKEKSVKAESSNPWDRIYGEINKDRPKSVKKRPQDYLNDDSDSEYDEEMDDFICDEDDEEVKMYSDVGDVSRHIREIFGYDKRKFRYESDHEISNMTANFAQCMKEEARRMYPHKCDITIKSNNSYKKF
ncbi:hypothetical protein KUTeg_023216 [Tegillarca granosa]|uniref:Protein SPT2 homolog n=1 Tax=Tegillarca granosa TaxID=220873 RepID=A0ABQ9E5Y6_TEGGR|nr:hypothetical protein KUTeg_023216 [Tegillarca granosa]